MAKTDEKPEANNDQPAKKSLPIKTIAVVAVVLVLEAVAIIGVFMFSGGPAPATAEALEDDPAIMAEQPVEVLIVADKFQNTRRGQTFLYDTEIFIVVKQKHAGEVEQRIETMRATITADISAIFRKAEPSQLIADELSVIRRQIEAVLDQRLGTDDSGLSMIEHVLIPKCTQFRADM